MPAKIYYDKHKAKVLQERRDTCSWLREIKVEAGCVQCGYNKSGRALQFHHRDPATKEFDVSRSFSYSRERLLKEIEKCDVICANCHYEEHEREES